MTWENESPRSPEWQRVQRQEDLLALLCDCIDRTQVIRKQAWSSGSWQQVFIEATKVKNLLEAIQAEESARWAEWHEAARAAKG